MNLRVFDTSNYIYAGDAMNKVIQRGVRESNGMFEANEAPIGGVRFLIRQAASYLSEPDTQLMFVFDTPPTIKRQMYADTFGDPYGYKGTRTPHGNGIELQRRYACELMRDVGFTVQCVEGYEADDIIYTLVNSLKDDYEHIYIHTRDSDLAFLVSDNVTIEKVGTQGKHIDLGNYSVNATSKIELEYNFLNYYKLFKGDKSDNIPGLGDAWWDAVAEVLPDSEIRKLGDLNLARKYLREAVKNNPTLPDGHLVLATFNILCPLLVPEEELDFYDADIDMHKLNYYLHDWNKTEDKWDLEDMLMTYIEDCHR